MVVSQIDQGSKVCRKQHILDIVMSNMGSDIYF